MKHLLIIFSLLLTSISWSEDIDSNDLVEREGLLYKKFTNEPFTGNSIGRKQGKVKEGKRDGEWLTYYHEGQLSTKNTYKEGKLHGESLMYNKNGTIYSKSHYKDGKLDGDWFYYTNGELRVKGYYKDGKRIK